MKAIKKLLGIGEKVSICRACFAMKTIAARSTVAKAMDHNSDRLTKELNQVSIDLIAIEIVAALIKNGTHKFRLESFGDIANIEQATNYIRICAAITEYAKKRNYSVSIAWWTKNIDLLLKAWTACDDVTREKAAANLCILVSSVFINVPESRKATAHIESVLGFAVKVFTVFDSEKTANAAGYEINCGARSCSTCGRCYRKTAATEYVCELLK